MDIDELLKMEQEIGRMIPKLIAASMDEAADHLEEALHWIREERTEQQIRAEAT